jgi:hypothetical protein
MARKMNMPAQIKVKGEGKKNSVKGIGKSPKR